MAKQFSEKTIVLSRRQYGEADLIVTVLTESGNLVTGIAKNGLKSKRRFGAAFDLFVVGETSWRESRGAVVVFVETRSREMNIAIRKSVETTISASFGSELIISLFGESSGGVELFAQMASFLSSVPEARCLQSLRLTFALRCLSMAGFAPQLIACQGCRSVLAAGTYRYVSEQKVVYCSGCFSGVEGMNISVDVASSLVKIMNHRVTVFGGVVLSKETICRGEKIVAWLLEDLDVKLKSNKLL